MLVSMTAECWGLKATRNRASERPSASTIVAAALTRHGFKKLGEWHVEKIFGEHVRLAGRLSASMPAI